MVKSFLLKILRHSLTRLFAQIISSVLNPIVILIPVPYILVIKTTGSKDSAIFWTIFTLIFILAFSIFILAGVEKGYFSDLDISKRSQRPLLFTFAIAICAMYTVLLYFLKAPEILFIAVFGMIMGLASIELVNKITKASIHVATVSAFATSLVLGFGPVFLLSFIVIPLVSWARIVTKNHTKKQTIIGALLGILTTLVVYVIFKYII